MKRRLGAAIARILADLVPVGVTGWAALALYCGVWVGV